MMWETLSGLSDVDVSSLCYISIGMIEEDIEISVADAHFWSKDSTRANILVKKVDPSQGTFRSYSGGSGPAPMNLTAPSITWRASTSVTAR